VLALQSILEGEFIARALTDALAENDERDDKEKIDESFSLDNIL
jgi:hypothetical protein